MRGRLRRQRAQVRLPRHLNHVPEHPRGRELRQPVDRQKRMETVPRGAGPRSYLKPGRADQDEGDHGED